MAETVSDVSLKITIRTRLISISSPPHFKAVKTIEQGHVRVGPTPVTDPALLVTRNMEDLITWVDTSARKRTVMRYNDEVGVGDVRAQGRWLTLKDDSWMILTCYKRLGCASRRRVWLACPSHSACVLLYRSLHLS